jgi:hypothetical protein
MPTFEFSSPDSGAHFECSLDSGPFAACTSPDTVGPLADGAHTFAVRAIDAAGNTDPTPASQSFTINPITAPVVNVLAAVTGFSASLLPPKAGIKISKTGIGKLSAKCNAPPGSTCKFTGSLLGTLAQGSRAAKTTRIGRISGSVPGGKTGKLTIKLTKKALAQLRRTRKAMNATVKLKVMASIGGSESLSKKVRLKLARR